MLDDVVIDIPFLASFNADIKTALTSIDAILTRLHSLLASILIPFNFIQYTDYMTFFKNDYAMLYYDTSKGLVIFVPLLDAAIIDDFKIDNFSCSLSQRDDLIRALEDYHILLDDQSLFRSLQHDGFKVTKEKLLPGTSSSFYIYTRHPNCIINYYDKTYTLHYRPPDQPTSRNALQIDHPNVPNTFPFLERFVLDSELRGHADYILHPIDASALITSIAHLSGIKSITCSCLEDFRFEARIDIRDRFRDDIPLEATTCIADRIEDVLNWSYRQAALMALIQQAKVLERPVQLVTDDLVRIGGDEFVRSDRLECIIGMSTK